VTDELFDLPDRVAIVTGGGTGIGAATARMLAGHGADAIVAARTLADLERTATAVEGAPARRYIPVPTDVKVEEQVIARRARGRGARTRRHPREQHERGGSSTLPLAQRTRGDWESSGLSDYRSSTGVLLEPVGVREMCRYVRSASAFR
jgi:short chain dehydrogenase